MKLFVVVEGIGSYDDYRQGAESIWDSREAAEAHVAEKQRLQLTARGKIRKADRGWHALWDWEIEEMELNVGDVNDGWWKNA